MRPALQLVALRLLHGSGVLFAASLVVFLGFFAIGDPVDVMISPQATQADRAAAIRSLGLDRPLVDQYLAFLWRALHGDLGQSWAFGQPSIMLILQRLPATLELALAALALSLLVGVPIGLAIASRPYRLADETVMFCSILGYSLPLFWTGMMLIMVFAVWLQLLPAGGRGDVGTILGIATSLGTWSGMVHLILPATSLALFKASLVVRLTRSGALDVLRLDFVRTARAKGLRESRVMFRHVLRNALIPLVSVVGMEFGNLVAFSVVTETIFAWPGAGKLLIDSINRVDRPVVVAYVLVSVLLFTIVNLVVDLVALHIDPRVGTSRA